MLKRKLLLALIVLAGVSSACEVSSVSGPRSNKPDTTGTDTTDTNPPPPPSCPPGFGFVGNCSTPTWGNLRPADTTIVIATRYGPSGFVYIPAGFSTQILVVPTRGCVAHAPPRVSTTSTANVYRVVDTLQGTATCRDSVTFTVSGTTARTFIRVTVVSLSPGITIIPDSVNAPVGDGGQHSCTVTGLTDLRCWYYSTDPSRAAVIQKDTTFSGPTAPWNTLAPNTHLAGEWKHLFAGRANVCVFSPSDPRFADCAVHIVTAGSSIIAASRLEEVVFNDYPITVELDLIHKMVPKKK